MTKNLFRGIHAQVFSNLVGNALKFVPTKAREQRSGGAEEKGADEGFH